MKFVKSSLLLETAVSGFKNEDTHPEHEGQKLKVQIVVWIMETSSVFMFRTYSGHSFRFKAEAGFVNSCGPTSIFWASSEDLKLDLMTTLTSSLVRPTSLTRGMTLKGRMMSLVVRYLRTDTESDLVSSRSDKPYPAAWPLTSWARTLHPEGWSWCCVQSRTYWDGHTDGKCSRQWQSTVYR